MSPDEFVVLVLAGMVFVSSVVAWIRLLAAERLVDASVPRGRLVTALLVAMLIVLAVLVTLAAGDVRANPVYLGLYLVLGGAWIGLGTRALPAMGLDPVVDAIDRRNPAALPGSIGAILGITLCYAGANIGDGPGWWVVLFCALLSTAAWLASWAVVNLVTHVTDVTTIDRDEATGIRLGAWLAALGAVFGRGVAGDWVSLPATLVDFVRFAWPAGALVVVECAIGLAARPRPDHPTPSTIVAGWVPGVAYVMAAVAWVLAQGWPQ